MVFCVQFKLFKCIRSVCVCVCLTAYNRKGRVLGWYMRAIWTSRKEHQRDWLSWADPGAQIVDARHTLVVVISGIV